MVLGKTDLLNGFKELGVKSGDILLVHSALSSFGFVNGGADTVIDALLDAVGPEGTVFFPALTGKREDGKDCPPVFDVRYTSSWTGRIPETFRQRPESRRSLHPTHSVSAVGALSNYLIDGHEDGSSPCDKKSPYFKNAAAGGYILLIGVDQESNTTVHCCEEVAGVPYHLQQEKIEIPITNYDGSTVYVRNRLHDWDKPPTDFNKLDESLLLKGIMNKGRVGNSLIRRINAHDMLEFTVELLQKTPFFLLR